MPSSTIPTTIYPFPFTTGYSSGTSAIPFTTPKTSATVLPFAPGDKCCARWSQFPQDHFNDRCTNHHAFWDLYACCNGAEPQAYLCSATCQAVGQTWQELICCSEKRAKVVVCKPDFEEIARNETETPAASGSGTALYDGRVGG